MDPVSVASLSFTVLILMFAFYFLPSIIAMFRGHKNIAGIIILNLFLGWTMIGWLGALIWSVLSQKEPEVRYIEREVPLAVFHSNRK